MNEDADAGFDRPARVRTHRDLEVWHRGIDLTVAVYRATATMPKSETYGLTDQIRRAAASVPANVAEGSGRRTSKDLLHLLSIASGSLREVDTHLQIIERLEMPVETTEPKRLVEEVSRMLAGLIRSLASR